MENRVQIPMRLPFIVYPPMFQGLGDRLSKSPWVSSILTADAIFTNTLGEGNERSLIGKTTALYAVVIQFESESIVEVVSNVLTLIDIEGYNLTRL